MRDTMLLKIDKAIVMVIPNVINQKCNKWTWFCYVSERNGSIDHGARSKFKFMLRNCGLCVALAHISPSILCCY